MSYCLNPNCPSPQNPEGTKFCITCGTKLLLKERYRTIKPIGQGGFGRTFLAVDEDKPSKPPCVIKQFFPQAQGTSTLQKAVELFNQEAVRLEELGGHPQIPDLLAHFTQDDRQYLVQEFINGQNLAQELAQQGAFSETQIKELLYDLLPVLQFIHKKQVIHRDIKPENIIRRSSDRKLFLVDFGASKVVSGNGFARPGTAIGSPEYVAPEQIRGQAVFGSDIYSLGVTCINLLTNISPFDLYDNSADAWVWQQKARSPVNDSLVKILNKMIESNYSRRYQSADEVLQDLNSQQPQPGTGISTPVTPAIPFVQSSASKTGFTPTKSVVDNELAEVSSQFLGGNIPTPQNPQPTLPKPDSATVAKSKSQIDLELDQLRSEFKL